MPFILGPEQSALEAIRTAAGDFPVTQGAIIVAWARLAGVGLLRGALGDALRNVDVIVGLSSGGTSAEALAHLLRLARGVYVFHKHHRQTFHPKAYLFSNGDAANPIVRPRQAVLLVGSSNLTGGGLFSNFEGNVVLPLRPSDGGESAALYDSVVAAALGLQNSPFCEHLASDARIRELLEDGYVRTEKFLQQKRAQEAGKAPRHGLKRAKPEAPPPPLPGFNLPPLDVRFADDVPVDDAGVQQRPAGRGPVAHATEQFFVRTLTENDVNKLHGRTPGTAEWDLGETARDEAPMFWGWPDQYVEVQRRETRREWSARGLLRSRRTGLPGLEVEVMLWYRAERPAAGGRIGHAAEHRLRVGPRPNLLAATPNDFDVESLIVVERFPPGSPHDFLVQMITRQDPEYDSFAAYLHARRPRHRYGYGP